MNPAKEANVDAALQEASVDQPATLAPSVLGASGSVESLLPHSPTPVELSAIKWMLQGKSPVRVEPLDPLMLPDMLVLDNNPALEESEEVGHTAPPSLEADDVIVATKKRWPTLKKPPACEFYNGDFCAFATEVLQALDVSDSACTPNSYDEAITSPEAAKWIKAMKAKYSALNCNSTFKLALLPVGLCAIRSKWLYKIKCKASSVIDCLKARWVRKGYAQ